MAKMKMPKWVGKVVPWLVGLGALNMGLVAWLNFDGVAKLGGVGADIAHKAVGVAAVLFLLPLLKIIDK